MSTKAIYPGTLDRATSPEVRNPTYGIRWYDSTYVTFDTSLTMAETQIQQRQVRKQPKSTGDGWGDGNEQKRRI